MVSSRLFAQCHIALILDALTDFAIIRARRARISSRVIRRHSSPQAPQDSLTAAKLFPYPDAITDRRSRCGTCLRLHFAPRRMRYLSTPGATLTWPRSAESMAHCPAQMDRDNRCRPGRDCIGDLIHVKHEKLPIHINKHRYQSQQRITSAVAIIRCYRNNCPAPAQPQSYLLAPCKASVPLAHTISPVLLPDTLTMIVRRT